MMLDKNAVNLLLSLDDNKLAAVIGKLAADAGIPPSSLNFGPKELAGIRSALSLATDDDLKRAGELLSNYKNGKNNG